MLRVPCSQNGGGVVHTLTNHVVSRSWIALLSDVNHDPPLKLYGIPARYANATYSAASKAGQLEMVQRDLDAFQHVRKPSFVYSYIHSLSHFLVSAGSFFFVWCLVWHMAHPSDSLATPPTCSWFAVFGLPLREQMQGPFCIPRTSIHSTSLHLRPAGIKEIRG